MTKLSTPTHTDATVVIRTAVATDADALRRLAALDSARLLAGEIIVAETDGALHAAYSLDETRAIADPFVPTAGLVELLRTRARLLRGGSARRTRAPGRLGLRLLARS